MAVLAFAGLSSTFMFTLVIPIQSELPVLLDSSRDDTAWVVTITVLASAIVTPIAGRLGDLFGKRRVVLALVGSMIAGSALAALSDGLVWMLVARGLQGVMAGVIPLGIAIMRDVLHPQRIPSAIALMSATMGVGGALGLPVSALIVEAAHWRGLFWLSAVLGALVFVLVAVIVPPSTLRASGRFDVWGALGLAAGMSGVLVAVSRGSVWGWGAPITIGTAVSGIAILAVWVRYQMRTRDPLLDLRVAARRPVMLTNLTSLALGFGLFASNVIYPQILALPAAGGVGLGLSLFAASVAVMPSGLVILLLSPVCGRLAARWGPKPLMIVGAAAILAAYVFSLAWHDEVWQIIVANVLVGVGIAFSFSATPLLILRSVRQEETGALNGLNALHRSVGTTMASAVVGVVLAAFTVPGMSDHPSAEGFQIAFGIAAAGAAFATVIALFLPSRPSAPDAHPALPTVAG